VLLPGETPESVVAEKAVKAAESVVSAAQQSLNETAQSMRRQAQETALERAQERLDKAQNTAKAVEKRCELIGKFVGICSRFRKAQENAQKHRLLLEWILNEMHSVEEEMDGAQQGSSSRRKRARRNSDEELEEPNAKKQRTDAQVSKRVESDAEPGLQAPSSATSRKECGWPMMEVSWKSQLTRDINQSTDPPQWPSVVWKPGWIFTERSKRQGRDPCQRTTVTQGTGHEQSAHLESPSAANKEPRR
jgi:hypothetical protein